MITKHELRDLYIKETGNPFPGYIIKYADWLEEKFTSTNTDNLQCQVCGSQKVNIIHECEDCKSPIDVSNWRDRTKKAKGE